MRRNPKQDNQDIVVDAVPLSIGARGLDLRRPSDPETLTELLNARFEDQRTVKRRNGHLSTRITDSGTWTNDKELTNNWVYGHGTVIVPAGSSQESVHHPISTKGRGCFEFGDSQVVWTGDRLLTETSEGPFLGEHTFWNRNSDLAPQKYGIPAYMPVQTDYAAPAKFTGVFSTSCLTATQSILAASDDTEDITVVVIDRETRVVLTEDNVATSGEALYVRLINSGGTPVVFWLDGGGLKYVYWNAQVWSDPSVIDADAEAFNVTQVAGGCQLIWRVADDLFAGRFSGSAASDAPHAFGSPLYVDTYIPVGRVAVAVAPNGDIAYAWDSQGIDPETGTAVLTCYSSTGDLSEGPNDITELSVERPWAPGLTMVYRSLKGEDGRYSYAVYSNSEEGHTYLWEVPQAATDDEPLQEFIAYNSMLRSTAFRIGDEVFAWLYSTNSDTSYLVAGVSKFQVCGISERETTEMRASGDDWGLANVEPDPLDEYKFVWLRPFNSGIYFRRADLRLGEMNFLPRLSSAAYGKSVYLAGSHVRQWDGRELGDAGFHDYPVIQTATPSNSGGTTEEGVRFFRVYPVRYNNQGERVQGAAVTSDAVTLATGEDTVTLTLKTVPVTNHDDVILEVYATVAGGTEFILSGQVANSRTAATVTYVHNISDAVLETQPGDPHAPGVDGLQELEEFGPIGCEILVTAADRLWGARGQVPAGCVQFSKLYEVGEGVGFDALASLQTLSAEGKELTALTAYGDQAIVGFTKDTIYGLYGPGPDNFGQGAFGVPQYNVTDGAINQQGVIAFALGIAYFAESGPRVLGSNLRVENICEPVEPISNGFVPTGARIDIAKQELIWYSEAGPALLWCYSGSSRWARWTGVPVAGVSPKRIVTPTGQVWTPSYDTARDGGSRFEFAFATGNLTLNSLLAGGTQFLSYGMSGQYNGEHRVWFYLYYNGSPAWAERVRWTPITETWFAEYDEDERTPEELDAAGYLDQSGAYHAKIKANRTDCRFVKLYVSDGGDAGFTPWELCFDIGAKPGLGRGTNKDVGD